MYNAAEGCYLAPKGVSSVGAGCGCSIIKQMIGITSMNIRCVNVQLKRATSSITFTYVPDNAKLTSEYSGC